jgi:hypothetical protein
MTTTATPKAARKREPICPPWCEGHNDTYQCWEVVDGHPCRSHSSRAVREIRSEVQDPGAQTDGGASVEITQLETPGAMSMPAVTLIVGDGAVDVTPDQARAYVAMVLEAVEVAEREQGPQA